jgi:hypothetical protein
LFGWQTFKRVGASLPINRYYKLVLTLSIVIQLSLYFMLATTGMWLDQLWHGSIARYASLMSLYKAVFITTIIVSAGYLSFKTFLIHSVDDGPLADDGIF